MAVSQAIQEEVLKEAYSATPNYDVDYNDPRFGKVESDKNQALTELESTYDGMVDRADDFYDDLKNQHQAWADKQAEIQQQQTDFTIEKIEQQKEQAEKDYLKEQSGAYVDWQKQSNAYGVEAEKMASAGLTNTGYSESSQVSMYNTYQNRVATAREVLAKAKLNYDNGIKEAMLQNNAAIAEIYATNYIKQAELALQGFQYKNDLLLDLANKKIEVDNIYYNRYQDVLQQINTENAMKEEVRQYNETQKWNTEQAELNRQHDKEIKELQHTYNKELAEIEHGYDKEIQEIQHGYDKRLAEIEQNYKIAYLNAQTEKEKEILKIQHENDIKKLNQQLANEKALAKYEYELKAQSVKITGGSGSSGSKKSSGSSSGSAKVSGGSGSVSGGSNPSVNTKSKLTLGKGPISDTKAAEMVNNGTATATIKNNQVYLSPATYIPTKLQNLQSTVKTTNKKTGLYPGGTGINKWGSMK